MKLYYVVNARVPNKKAYGIQLAKMCEAFVEQGIDLTLVIPRTRASRTALRQFYNLRVDVRTVTLPGPDWFGSGKVGFAFSSGLFMLTSFLYLLGVRLRGRDGVIYTIDMDTFSYTLLPLAGLPCFAEMHNTKPYTFFGTFFFSRAAGIIATNSEIKKSIAERFDVSGARLTVEPNGVDAEWFKNFSKTEARRQLGLPGDQKITLYVGRFYAWKGLEILAHAAACALDISWYVVGGSAEEFKKATGVPALPDNLHCAGEYPPERIPQWLAASDVLLVLGTQKNSQSYRFTAPMKVFEYMAAGRPIVASATPALQDVVPQEHAVWYEPDNATDLAEKIKTAAAGDFDTEHMVEQAYEYAKNRTWKKRVERIYAFIKKNI